MGKLHHHLLATGLPRSCGRSGLCARRRRCHLQRRHQLQPRQQRLHVRRERRIRGRLLACGAVLASDERLLCQPRGPRHKGIAANNCERDAVQLDGHEPAKLCDHHHHQQRHNLVCFHRLGQRHPRRVQPRSPIVLGRGQYQRAAIFPEVFYGLSDAGLGTTDVNAYENGTGGGTYCQGSTCISIAAPGGVSCTGGSTSPYPNPYECYGNLVQFPFSVDPVANFYTNKGICEKVSGAGVNEIDYHLNVYKGTKSGGVRLSVWWICGDLERQHYELERQPPHGRQQQHLARRSADPTPAGSWSVPDSRGCPLQLVRGPPRSLPDIWRMCAPPTATICTRRVQQPSRLRALPPSSETPTT